jgi:hypothetical protein
MNGLELLQAHPKAADAIPTAVLNASFDSDNSWLPKCPGCCNMPL